MQIILIKKALAKLTDFLKRLERQRKGNLVSNLKGRGPVPREQTTLGRTRVRIFFNMEARSQVLKKSEKIILIMLCAVSLLVGCTKTATPVKKTQIRWFVGLGAGSDEPTFAPQKAVVEKFNASQNEIELVLEIIDIYLKAALWQSGRTRFHISLWNIQVQLENSTN